MWPIAIEDINSTLESGETPSLLLIKNNYRLIWGRNLGKLEAEI